MRQRDEGFFIYKPESVVTDNLHLGDQSRRGGEGRGGVRGGGTSSLATNEAFGFGKDPHVIDVAVVHAWGHQVASREHVRGTKQA